MNNKGLSAVVTTIIIVAIGLVAVAVVFAVVQNLLQGETGKIDVSAKCTGVGLHITSLKCTDNNPNTDTCAITLKRTYGTEVLSGVKTIFTDGNGVTGTLDTQPGDIGLLQTKDYNFDTGLDDLEKVEVYPYFTVEGQDTLCGQPAVSSTKIVY
jgi:hypothetical protein